jgi:16S rRNA (cytosine967-C5)-methyltransferase
MPPAAGAGAARQAPPLWRQLQLLARLIEGVGAGQSLTRLLEGAPPALRAGAQALSFEVLRHWGTAQALRGRLAPRRPAPLADALLCSALALLLPGCARPTRPSPWSIRPWKRPSASLRCGARQPSSTPACAVPA